MPHFNALLALEVLRGSGLDIPFIIISGTVGEEIAVEAMLTGAHDYLSKDNLTRLVPAVERELKEATNRRQLRWEGEERRVSEARYRTLFEYAPDGIIISGPDNYYLDANASMCEMLGYSHQELIGLHASDIVIRSEVKDLDFEFALVQSTPDYNREWHFKRKDGTEFPAEVIATIMPDGNLLAMIRDVTERKNADDSLQEKTAVLEAQLDSSIDGILVVDAQGKKIIQNQKLIDLLKIPENIANNTDDSQQVKWVTRMMKFPEQFIDRVKYLYAHPLEISRDEIELTDGTILDRYSAPVLGKNNKYYGRIWTFRDMTESKRASIALLESEARLRTIIDTEPECVKLIAKDGSLLEMNPAGLRMIEADSFEQVANSSVFGLIAEQDRKAFKALTNRVFRGETGTLAFHLTGLKGAHRWLDTHASPLRDAAGEIVALLGITRDITESKRADTERRIIFEIIQGSITTPDLKEFLTLVHRSISEIVYAENFIVMLHDVKNDTFEYEFWADTFDPIPQPRPVGNGFGSYVLQTGQPLLLTKELKRSMIDRGEAKLSGTPSRSWLGVPLRTPTQTIGVMVVQHYEIEDAYDQRDLEFMSSVADQIALAIDRKRAEEKLRESESLLAASQRITHLGSWIMDISESGTAVINSERWSDEHYRIFGLEPGEIEITDELFYNAVHPNDREPLARMLRETIEHQKPYDLEHRIILPDGTERTVHAMAEVVVDPTSGKPAKLLGSVQDITDRKLAEAALRESNEKFQQLADNISDVFWVRSLDMQDIYYVSPAFEKVWGRSVESLLADPTKWAEFVYPEDRPRVKQAFDGLQNNSPTLDIEYRIVRPDDSIRWVRVRGFPVKDATGTLIRFAGIVSDITERKQVAESLAESEERYRELVENALDIIYTHDLKGNYTSVNKAAETITGYTNEEIMAMNMADSIPATQLKKAQRMIAAKLAGEQITAYELELLAKDGHGIAVEVNTRIIYENGLPIGVQGIARDITERNRSREALESSERTLRELADQLESDRKRLVEAQTLAKVGSWHTDLVTGELIWSAETFRIFDVDPETRDLDHRAFLQYVHPDDRDAVDSAFTNSMDKDSECEINHRVLLADGSVKYVEERWQIVHDDDGKPLRAIGSVRDVTERTIVEQALEAAEENYRSIFENAVEGIFQSTLDGAFISANPAMARILGFDSPADLLASRTDIGSQHYVDPASRIELEKILAEHGIAAAYECEVYQKDGTKIWTQENIRTIRRPDGGILHYEGSIEDITARKSLEDQFRQSQKMEAVGVLAGGIAHDFNNLLTAINGYSDLTLRKMPSDDPLRHNVEEVKKAGDRAAELTSQLLAFSRKQVLKPMVHGLNTVIENIENMLRRIIRENIELRTVLDPNLGNIKADPGQVEQIIMNLSVNARDAMPHGGTLTIETQNAYLDEDYVSQHLTIAPGPFVRLTVTDTGVGMDESTKRHIFEPFFTTKEVGKGTGLGLSMVYGVVKQSGGDIMVYSELEHGTTFKIYLPRVDETVERPKWTGERKQMYLGTETVLLVEDEDVVRNLVHEILTEGGYKVLECNSGAEALKVCSSYRQPIHLLLSDVIMPKMSGSELKDEIVKILPDIKILFMSGYTDDSIANRGVFDDAIAFIEKPFTPDALARKVREVLEN